jgi:hypothetical protein
MPAGFRDWSRFAVGALLGAVFIELLPHALELGSPARDGDRARGLLAFFSLEKLVLWRHSHGHAEHRDDADEIRARPRAACACVGTATAGAPAS